MIKSPIEFKTEREFGDIFNSTFSFIGQEYKSLGKAMLLYVFPFLLISAILMVFMGAEQQKVMGQMDPNTAIENPFYMFQAFGAYYFFAMIVLMLAVSSMRCTIIAYIKLYVKKGKDNFTSEELWKEISKYFFPVLGSSILTGILIGIGFMFCFLPGIYIGVSLSLLYSIMIIENQGFGSAFSRSFKLVKSKFWMTLGLLIIVYIIMYLLTLLFSIPAMIAGIKPLLSNINSFGTGETVGFGLWYYLLNAITTLISYSLMSVPIIMMAFQFFSIRETLEKPSLDQKINLISENE